MMRWEHSLSLFELMPVANLTPDVVSFSVAIRASEQGKSACSLSVSKLQEEALGQLATAFRLDHY